MTGEDTYDSLPWFVIHTHLRQEDRAQENLKAWGVETFNPKIKEIKYNQYTGERFYSIKPLFPRYIFARFKVSDSFYKLRFTRGVHQVVSFNEGPCPVDDQIISLIRARMTSDGLVQLSEELKPGDEVMISQGPLKNFTGIFQQHMKDVDRVKILLNAVSYQASLVIDRQDVMKKAGPVA